MLWGLGVMRKITFNWGNQEKLYGNRLELKDVDRYRYLQVVGKGLFVLNSGLQVKLQKP